jgi:hypothetical protein
MKYILSIVIAFQALMLVRYRMNLQRRLSHSQSALLTSK